MKNLIVLLLVLPLAGAEPAGYKYWSAAELKSLTKPLSSKADAKRPPKIWLTTVTTTRW